MKLSWQKLLLLSAVGMFATGAGITASMAQDAEKSDEGTVIRIGPDGAKDPLPSEVDIRPRLQRSFQPWLLPGDPNQLQRQQRAPLPYYIGVAAAPVSDQLRAHIDLPEDVGLIVLQVFEGSPADEAGLKVHDILLAADGNDLHSLDDLIGAVKEHSGENITQFTLDVIRHGQPQTMWVTPAERPKQDQLVQPGFSDDVPGHGFDHRELLDRMLQGRDGFGMQGFNFNQMPGNVSVQVERKDGQPARVTIERDGESWVIDGDDPKSLEQLPEDLRPMVEGMLNGQHGFEAGSGIDFGQHLPDDLRERVRQMEEEMKELRGRALDNAEQR